MKEHISKVVRVEDIPRQSITDARIEIVTAHKEHIDQGTQSSLSTLLNMYEGYVEARTPPKQQVVIFESLKIKLP